MEREGDLELIKIEASLDGICSLKPEAGLASVLTVFRKLLAFSGLFEKLVEAERN